MQNKAKYSYQSENMLVFIENKMPNINKNNNVQIESDFTF